MQGKKPSTKSAKMAKKAPTKPVYDTSSDRKSVIKDAYDKAVENGWHVGEAGSWATKKHGVRITKGDIQYYAMKNKLPYLDELRMGIRTKVF